MIGLLQATGSSAGARSAVPAQPDPSLSKGTVGAAGHNPGMTENKEVVKIRFRLQQGEFSASASAASASTLSR
jgi:hypothetical protein